MVSATNIAPQISEPLTWQEICERYPEQWVCLVEIDKLEEQNFEFHTARVVGHGKTRRETRDQARPLRARIPRAERRCRDVPRDTQMRRRAQWTKATRWPLTTGCAERLSAGRVLDRMEG
jgi:hypothetical protein